MSKARSFIALPLSAANLASLAELQQRLASTLPGFRPMNPHNLHLTLVFLGDRSAPELAEIGRIMLSVGGCHAPFSTQAQGLLLLGRPGGKRPLCLGIEPAEPLLSLQAALAEALAGSGERPEKRPFRPHLTLGRTGAPFPKRGDLLSLACEPLPLRFDRVNLYTSRLLPQGAEHQVATEVFLKKETARAKGPFEGERSSC